MQSFIAGCLGATREYLLVVLGATALFLVLSLAAGYMPWGDFPGPGWQDWSWQTNLKIAGRNLPFVLGFSVLAAVPAAGMFLPAFLLVRLFRRTPRWMVGLVGGALSSVAAGSALLLAHSFLITLSPATIAVGVAAGAYFGAALLPRYVRPAE